MHGLVETGRMDAGTVTLIEDYALLSDSRSAALVSKAGSIDWLCLPRFDSAACFARLLGDEDNGHWTIGPVDDATTSRRYLEGSLVLETEHRTATGTVVVTDALVATDEEDGPHRLVRRIEGRSGSVPMRMVLRIRFDYGHIVPWVRHVAGGLHAIGGPDGMLLRAPVELRPEGFATVAEFVVDSQASVAFDLSWHHSTVAPPAAVDVDEAIDVTAEWWRNWSSRLSYDGAYKDEVKSSLIVLKGLSHRSTGGIVAAPTTSLPEWIGGERNWDYRYCWLRDASFTLVALTTAGYVLEAAAWRDWLVRAVAGEPSKVQIMYGLGGERRLPEMELGWLGGYRSSKPVRIGNAASDQLQLDVFGEVMDAIHLARVHGMEPEENAWRVQTAMLEWLEGNWSVPDEGIWEVRGERAHYTYSKVMAWVAFDRAVNAVERLGLDGDAGRWRTTRQEIHDEVCANAVDDRGVFTQSYGSSSLDASALMIPLVGFVPADDPRVTATIDAIQRELTVDGLVRRYDPEASDDGVGGEEGAFLLCSFWLVDNLVLAGRSDEATALYERLLELRNDVGLLAEEYDPKGGHQLGNFPQAFSHVALASSAMTLCPGHVGPSQERSGR